MEHLHGDRFTCHCDDEISSVSMDSFVEVHPDFISAITCSCAFTNYLLLITTSYPLQAGGLTLPSTTTTTITSTACPSTSVPPEKRLVKVSYNDCPGLPIKGFSCEVVRQACKCLTGPKAMVHATPIVTTTVTNIITQRIDVTTAVSLWRIPGQLVFNRMLILIGPCHCHRIAYRCRNIFRDSDIHNMCSSASSNVRDV